MEGPNIGCGIPICAIDKIPSKAVRKYLLQFYQLTLKKEVLHHLYINNNVEYHQLVLSQIYHTAAFQMIHDDSGLGSDISLGHERFYWSTMYQDISDYVANCPHCQITKGHYVGPNTPAGSLIALYIMYNLFRSTAQLL